MSMDLSVVLPTYNERESICPLIEALLEQFRGAAMTKEVIVVDDDSTDGTAELVCQRFGSSGVVRVLVRKKERGLATAIRTGIEDAAGKIVIIMDSDFNHDPRGLPLMVELCRYFDIVVGSRYISGGGMLTSRFRYWGSYAFNLLIRLVLCTPVHDHLSGFLAVRREVLERLQGEKIFYGYGDYCIRLLYHALHNGFRLIEIPVVYQPRQGGESKTDLWRLLVQYALSTLRLRLVGR